MSNEARGQGRHDHPHHDERVQRESLQLVAGNWKAAVRGAKAASAGGKAR
jgi:hypothetical protein